MADDEIYGGIYDEELQYWFAGFQDANGEYRNLQDESGAVDYGDVVVHVDWERWERFDNRNDFQDDFVNADFVVIGWIDPDGNVNYATLPDGIDLDYFDFEDWVEDYG